MQGAGFRVQGAGFQSAGGRSTPRGTTRFFEFVSSRQLDANTSTFKCQFDASTSSSTCQLDANTSTFKYQSVNFQANMALEPGEMVSMVLPGFESESLLAAPRALADTAAVSLDTAAVS